MRIRAQIRAEQERDQAAVHALNAAAFETTAEADLVDRLRREARPLVSLVAEEEGTVVGHILFTSVELPDHSDLRLMALAPMAVAPAHQARGIGSALVREGLERCRHLGTDAVIVLGHPDYYPRFGFTPPPPTGASAPPTTPRTKPSWPWSCVRAPWRARAGWSSTTGRLTACEPPPAGGAVLS